MIIWTPGVSLEENEREIILAAMKHHNGNKSAVARSLNITVKTVDNKLEKYAKDDAEIAEAAIRERHKSDEFLQRQRGSYNPQAAAFEAASQTQAPDAQDTEHPHDDTPQAAPAQVANGMPQPQQRRVEINPTRRR